MYKGLFGLVLCVCVCILRGWCWIGGGGFWCHLLMRFEGDCGYGVACSKVTMDGFVTCVFVSKPDQQHNPSHWEKCFLTVTSHTSFYPCVSLLCTELIDGLCWVLLYNYVLGIRRNRSKRFGDEGKTDWMCALNGTKACLVNELVF